LTGILYSEISRITAYYNSVL